MPMANLTIKDLPDEVYDELKVAARSECRSLNGYIVALLKAIVDEASRRKLMRDGRKEFRNFLGTQYETVPGYRMPALINLYGVRWNFAN